jgi:hypothetical protein
VKRVKLTFNDVLLTTEQDFEVLLPGFWFLPLAFSVVCGIYVLGSPVGVLFYSVPLIVFSFRANPFFYQGTIRS